MKIQWRHHVILIDDADAHLVTNRTIVVGRRGYAVVHWGGRRENGGQRAYLHHLILRPPTGLTVDHRNGNPLDNRRRNLRIATQSQQNQNRRKHNNDRVGYKGVWPNGRGFCAIIAKDKRRMYLGQYSTPEAAACAYDAAARQYFGEFACLNFPHGELE